MKYNTDELRINNKPHFGRRFNSADNWHSSVADPECAKGGGVRHILAEKVGVSFTL